MLIDPYTPGRMPVVLTGRDPELEVLRSKLGRMALFGGSGGALTVFHGPRGLGKTSLLRTAQREADTAGFLTVWAAGSEGVSLTVELAKEIDRRCTPLADNGSLLLNKVDQVQVELGVPGIAKIGAELTGTNPRATGDSAPQWAMRELGEDAAAFAQSHDRHGLVLFLDELHDAPVADRRALLHSVQTWDAEGAAVAVVGAGLPSLPLALTEAATFGERSDFHEIAPLTDAAVGDALTGPASKLGVTWTAQALASAVQYVQGYPYSVQLLGSSAWLEARPTTDGAVIEYAHAVAAQNRVAERMTDLYQARLSRLTDAEHAFVTVMADLGGRDVPRAEIAAALGRDSRSISRTRERLLAKGMIADTAHGRLSFTVPGLDVHIRARCSADHARVTTRVDHEPGVSER